MEPRHEEVESATVRSLLREVNLTPHGLDNSIYGNVLALDADTRALCEWCTAHDVTSHSLELQIWWRDHQAADAKKAADQTKATELAAERAQAIAKLTPRERRVLGLKA